MGSLCQYNCIKICTWGQVLSMRDNRKIYNTNYGKSLEDLKLRQKGNWKICAINQTNNHERQCRRKSMMDKAQKLSNSKSHIYKWRISTRTRNNGNNIYFSAQLSKHMILCNETWNSSLLDNDLLGTYLRQQIWNWHTFLRRCRFMETDWVQNKFSVFTKSTKDFTDTNRQPTFSMETRVYIGDHADKNRFIR